MTLTIGVDLATAPTRTFAATIEWHGDCATLSELRGGLTDDELVALAAHGPMGIDCAFGWPEAFVRFVSAAQDGIAPGGGELAGEVHDGAWRRSLAYRLTDSVVAQTTGRWPLSVATDRLGLVAMRLASVLASARRAGIRVSKDATGPLYEVYPAAALRIWSIGAQGYKASGPAGEAARRRIVDELARRAPWLEWNSHMPQCIANDDALDAVLAALITRAAERDAFIPVPPAAARQAAREGWIVLPTIGIEQLAG